MRKRTVMNAESVTPCQRFRCTIFQNLPKHATTMQSEERQARIEAYLLKAEFASLEELAQSVDASISTVRRDLGVLEKNGILRRTHGGARLLQPPKSDEFVFHVRDTHQVAEKEAIGAACAALIEPGQNV